MLPRFISAIGIVLAAWIALGRWCFGTGGPLTWWYLPLGILFAALQLWTAHRVAVTRRKDRSTSRSTIVCLALSWVTAAGFGLTLPDRVDGELESILSLATGSSFSAEMSIALCNPLGIIAFALTIAALAFAYADARDPRPEEDELIDGAGEEVRPGAHPLA